MRIAVVVASVNRAEEIGQLLPCLARQSLPPSAIVLSVVSERDLPAELPECVQVVMGPPGLTMQRNRGLDAILRHCDLVTFFDDDFLPAQDALAGMAALFAAEPEVVSATGLVLLDGVKAGGISYEAAMQAVLDYEAGAKPAPETYDILWAYGCNMAFRAAAIGTARFDENLPLHGWQEDMDFAAVMQARGRVIKTNAFAGVHRGVNKGRSPGFSMGFAQMVNPAYLVRKGTMRPKKAATLMCKNFLANHVKALRPEPFIDRRGRMLGNWRGLLHIMSGRADPKRILTFR